MLPYAALVLAVAASAVPHPDSLSRSRLTVDGATVEARLRFQELSVLEVLPELDLDRDGILSENELRAGEERLGRYLVARWTIRPDADEQPIAASCASIELAQRDASDVSPFSWLEARIVFEPGAPLDVFTISTEVFLEESPAHKDYVSVFFGSEPEVRELFVGGRPMLGGGDAGGRGWRFEPSDVRRPGVFASFLRLGFLHILEGYDHLAFLLALLVAAPRLRSLIGVVTAFTIAHSITLAWASIDPDGLVSLVPGRFVELAIALSIAYVAVDNLLRPGPRNAWGEAFAFGLLHGLGFAGFLADALSGEPLVVTALLGFNLGVEAGQILFVLATALVLFVLTSAGARSAGARPIAAPSVGREGHATDEGAPEPARGLAPRGVRVVASVGVAVVSLYWFAERAGWV